MKIAAAVECELLYLSLLTVNLKLNEPSYILLNEIINLQ